MEIKTSISNNVVAASDVAEPSILVVSDDFQTRHELVGLIRELACKPLRARSIREAQKALELKPALLIVDQRIRGSNGVSWIKWLRGLADDTTEGGTAADKARAAYYLDVPVVYCTSANCSNQTFNLLRNLLRVALIVHKPLVPVLLSNQIQYLLPKTLLPQVSQIIDQGPLLQFEPESERSLKNADSGDDNDMQETLTHRYNEEQETRMALAELGRTYLIEMPETLYEMRNQITTAALEHENVELLDAAITHAHRIKGTAGSLGFPDLSRMAGRIEALLRDYRAQGASADHQSIAGALILVAEIEMWLEDWLDKGQGAVIVLPDVVNPERVMAALPVAIDISDALPEPIAEIYSFLQPQSKNPQTQPLQALYPDLHRDINWVSNSRRRAAIVDVETGNIETLTTILNSTGQWQVESITGGVRALGHIEDNSPDLLIVQADGADLSGFDLCRMVRCNPKWASMQLIILTSDTSVEGRKAVFACGATDFIVTPLVAEEVEVSLPALINLKQS